MHWRRKWQPTPVFLPGESQGREAWRAAVYGVAQSRTGLKRCSSSSSSHPTILSPVTHFSSCLDCFPKSVFSSESAFCLRWPKYWSFSFSVSPSSEHWALISFRINWFDLLAVQGTLKILLQHHSSKASALQHSAFFMVQLSRPTGRVGCGEKSIVLTIQAFVSKLMPLPFNTLSSILYSILYMCVYIYIYST